MIPATKLPRCDAAEQRCEVVRCDLAGLIPYILAWLWETIDAAKC